MGVWIPRTHSSLFTFLNVSFCLGKLIDHSSILLVLSSILSRLLIILFQIFLLKCTFLGLGGSSVVKSACYSFRGLTSGGSQLYLQGTQHPLLLSIGTYTHLTYTHTSTDLSVSWGTVTYMCPTMSWHVHVQNSQVSSTFPTFILYTHSPHGYVFAASLLIPTSNQFSQLTVNLFLV